MSETQDPPVRFCPFCGSDNVRHMLRGVEDKRPGYGVPRCFSCRAVFTARFSRYVRKSPTKAPIAADRQGS